MFYFDITFLGNWKIFRFVWNKNRSNFVINNFTCGNKFLHISTPYKKKWDTIPNSKVKVRAKTSTRSIVWTLAISIIQLKKVLWAVKVHGCVEENVLKITKNWARLENQTEGGGEKHYQNLTGPDMFSSKPSTFWKDYFEKRPVENNSTEKLFHFEVWLFRKIDSKPEFSQKKICSKMCFLMKKNFFKIMVLEKHQHRNVCCFYGVNWVKTWF